MTTALVTGATGFIGSHLVRRLVGDGAEVHVLCRPQSGFARLGGMVSRIRRHEVALTDRPGLEACVRSIRPDHVFHLAATSVAAGAPAAADPIAADLLGTVNLLDACNTVGYRGLVTTGDAFEYAPSQRPLRESDECRPDTPHGISKLAATRYVRSRAVAAGSPSLTLRLFSIYGPGDHPRRLVPRVIAGALTGAPIALSRREISRDWLYVEDLIDLYLEAVRRAEELAGGVFNAGSGDAVTLGEITDLLLRLTGSHAPTEWGTFPAPPHDATPWTADMGRTLAVFRWRPRTTLEDGMRATIAAIASRAA